MRDFEVTGREVLASIIIIFIMTSIGFFISTNVHNSISVSNEKYFTSLKVDNSPDMFNHAIDTEVGNMLSFGTISANEAVSDDMIDGEFFAITKTRERYVQKTRTVTYTDSDGNVRTRTETYWEWDEEKRWRSYTETFSYLGKDFPRNKMTINNYRHHKTVKENYYIRYKFYVVPAKFDAAIYSYAEGKDINKIELYAGETIQQVVDRKESGADHAVIAFWALWVILTIIAVVGFVALENKLLNGR